MVIISKRVGVLAIVAEIVEPDIAAAIADHHPLIVVEVVVRILLEHIGLELGPNDARIMLEEPVLAVNDLRRLALGPMLHGAALGK
jgi:hypothetical protein